MSRRTPILAFLLAPVALVLLVALWRHAVVPLSRAVWYSDTVLHWRLDSRQPAIRIAAARDIASSGSEDPALLEELVTRLQADDSAEVRKAAAGTLGHLGHTRSLPPGATEVLSASVLTEEDSALLSAAIAAVGQSAANNRYPDPVVERLAAVLLDGSLAPLHRTAATALGQVGAAQKLPEEAFAAISSVFTDPGRAGERETLVDALTEIAKGQPLPASTLELLSEAFHQESHPRLRRALVYALAHAADDYPPAITLITEATHDPDPGVVAAAENGLRIVEYDRTFKNRDPLSLAVDTSQPPQVRLDALRIIRATPIDPAAFEAIAALAEDPNPEIALATLELFHYLARAPEDDFDQRVLIPQLTRAMSDPDPRIREAAYGALSRISIHRPAYLSAADFPAQLEAGGNDREPKVRVVAMATMMRNAGREQREELLDRALTDPEPYVRSMAAGWLGSSKTRTRRRQALLRQALQDPHPHVRAAAERSLEGWQSRKRAWPVELWRLWQAGAYGQVGLRILTAVTVATPMLVCGTFLLYFLARLLTLLAQRRWRAAAVVPVVAVWAAASYGMFLLYFVAAHAGDVDGGELALLTAILWGAIALYTTLGWGLHFAIRR